MTETPPEPPGSTATRPDPSDQHSRGQGADPGDRRGIDTEHLRDYRSLRRDIDDRKIAGVCGGLARHLDLDPTLVRVVMVVLAVFGGAGLVLYAALWLFVPEQGAASALIPVGDTARNAIVVVALVIALLVALPAGFDGDGGLAVPFVVLAVIVVAVLMSRDSGRRSAPPSNPSSSADSAGVTETGYPPYAHGTGGGSTAVPPPATTGWSSPRASRRGPLLFGITLASVALALGVLGLVDVTGASVPDAAYAALALAVVGGWLVVGSVFGRPGGLVLLGVLAAAALGIAHLVEPTYTGDRELVERPVVASQLDSDYHLPAGRAEIDLTGIRDVESLDGRSLYVNVNAGEILLVVPEDLRVDLEASIGAGGEITTPDVSRGGWGASVDQLIGEGDDVATLQAQLDVGFGRVIVRSE